MSVRSNYSIKIGKYLSFLQMVRLETAGLKAGGEFFISFSG